jgi:hypothetical protein
MHRSLLLRQRVAATGEWEPIQELDAPQYSGLDLVMDGNGAPQWITGDPRDDSWLPIWFNDVNIVDDDVYHSQYPTLAVGPNGVLVAVWEGDWNLSYQRRLFTATYNPAGIVTKHYYAGDERLAARVDDVLYYTLPDPTGTSLAITKANGDELGHVLYDALRQAQGRLYGAVLTSTVPATLTTTLAGSGDMPDPDTGLVYLGDGRYYDPTLGRPLQPNPVGGPPALPQALNRYAATPWGPPGVAEGMLNGLPPVVSAFGRQLPGAALSVQGMPQLAQLLTRPFMKTVPIDTGIIEIVGPRASVRFLEAEGFETLAVQPASGLPHGPLSRVFKGLQIQTLRGRMGIAGALAANPAFAEGESISLGRGVTARLAARDIEYMLDDVATQAATRRLANTLGVGVAGILSAGFQYANDYGNPYLAGQQKLNRALISDGLGIAA